MEQDGKIMSTWREEERSRKIDPDSEFIKTQIVPNVIFGEK